MNIEDMTNEDLRKLDRSFLEAELGNRVYFASRLIERLEQAGLVSGNGHRAAQSISRFAIDELRKQWIQPATMETKNEK